MKIKTIEVNGQTYAVLSNGKPVYLKDDGAEIEFDALSSQNTITRLNGEAKSHRERAEKAEVSLKTFEGITDPVAALEAIDKVAKIRDKKLLEAGEVDKVRSEAIKLIEDKYAPVVKERDTLQAALVSEKIGGSFARSKFIPEKLTVPVDMVQATFGQNFKLEEGAVVAYDRSGNKIYAPNGKDLASMDEALQVLVDQSPYRNSILKGSGASGGGARGPGNEGGKRSVTRSQFEAMSASEAASTAAEASAGKTVIVDNV